MTEVKRAMQQYKVEKVMLDEAVSHRMRIASAAAAAKLLQSCPTLRDPIDGSPPGSPSLGFSRQEYWSGLPFHSSGDLPKPNTK